MLKKILHSRYYMHFFVLFGIALFFLLLGLSPVQLPVILYKITIVVIAAIVAFFFDFVAFPYARPTSYLCKEWQTQSQDHVENKADYPIAPFAENIFCFAMLRRAIIISAFIFAVAMGL